MKRFEVTYVSGCNPHDLAGQAALLAADGWEPCGVGERCDCPYMFLKREVAEPNPDRRLLAEPSEENAPAPERQAEPILPAGNRNLWERMKTAWSLAR